MGGSEVFAELRECCYTNFETTALGSLTGKVNDGPESGPLKILKLKNCGCHISICVQTLDKEIKYKEIETELQHTYSCGLITEGVGLVACYGES